MYDIITISETYLIDTIDNESTSLLMIFTHLYRMIEINMVLMSLCFFQINMNDCNNLLMQGLKITLSEIHANNRNMCEDHPIHLLVFGIYSLRT